MARLSAYPYTRQISLRWKDNDVYGHVNNVEYYSYFDTVINEYLILEAGLDIHGGAAIGVCAESHCNFRASIAFPGTVLAGLAVDHLGTTSVRYAIGLFDREQERALADGSFVHVFVDRETRRPTPIPDDLRAALAALAAEPGRMGA